MASLTIRHLDDATKERLRARAAQHGRSMEAEVREILQQAVTNQNPQDEPKPESGNLYERIRAIVEPLGGIEFPEIDRRTGLPREEPRAD